jgi:hypothetical protein
MASAKTPTTKMSTAEIGHAPPLLKSAIGKLVSQNGHFKMATAKTPTQKCTIDQYKSQHH